MKAKPWLVLVLAGALVGVGAVGAVGVRADAARADAVGSKASTVEVVAKRALMSAPISPAVGSGFVAGGDLLDFEGSAKVGEGYSHCGVVSVSVDVPPSVTALCTSVFQLRGGELHLSGKRVYKSIALGFEDTSLAVVGGTGAYADIRGDGKVTRELSGTAQVGYRFVFTLADN